MDGWETFWFRKQRFYKDLSTWPLNLPKYTAVGFAYGFLDEYDLHSPKLRLHFISGQYENLLSDQTPRKYLIETSKNLLMTL
jgi:hypothetical protein